MELNDLLINSVKLDEIPKPGIKSQLKMAPQSSKVYFIENNKLRFAATIMLLYPIGKVLHFCLIRRTIKTDTHSNQIGFPGGKKDKSDKSYWDTAIRELGEEIGVKKEEVFYLTNLSKTFIPASNFVVYPFIARTDKRPNFKLNQEEVDYLIEVKLSMLLSKKSIGTSKVLNRKVPVFNFAGEKVWGATAMILSEARDLILLLK